MPEQEMHTTSFWLTLPRTLMAALPHTIEERRDGVVGLSHALGHLAALFLMCDRRDLGVAVGEGEQAEPTGPGGRRADALARRRGPLPASEAYEPGIYIYDNYPSGMGMSEPLFTLHARLLAEARALIAACPCDDGCPACTGPTGETGRKAKEVALAILDAIGPATEPRHDGGEARS
jgi:DEAD/DEAH box helicase domain-containing protein